MTRELTEDPMWRALSPDMRGKPLYQYLHINTRLSGWYSDDEKAKWWHAPHQQLDGESAIVEVLSGNGAHVIQILDRLDQGAFL